VTEHQLARAARRLSTIVLVLLAASPLLLAGAPASAADEPPEPPPTTPTFILCAQGQNSGRLLTVRAFGPGRLLVVGTAKPCRRPSALDAVAVSAEYPDPPRAGRAVGQPSTGSHVDGEPIVAFPTAGATDGSPSQRIVRFRNLTAGLFVDVVQVYARADRVCLADNPEHGLDCVAIRVPTTRSGDVGVPVVGGHTTTAGVLLPRNRPFCATCW